MPYKIAGQPGTWYEPGSRKGNVTIVWRGQLPDGKWTELVTNAAHQPGAEAHVRSSIAKWHRSSPPAAGATVDLDTAAHHYKATLRSSIERVRADRIVRYLGAKTPVAALNQSHVSIAADRFRAERAAATGRQTYPKPSAETVNREITTPIRAIVRFAAAAEWRSLIVLKAVKPLAGEKPRPRRPIARDETVDRLLLAIESAIAKCRPTATGRAKASTRRAASLKALYALILVIHERGYRISEWLRWDWETVNLGSGQASIMLSKPDRWQDFELSPEAVAALSALDARTSGRVFPWHGRSAVYNAVDTVAPKGLRWRPHESRRAVVTAVIRNTGDPVAARDYVGHANIKTTLRYSMPDQTSPQVRAGGSRVGKR